MTLRFKDHGEPVKRLQRNLNKLGSILLVDGDFGPGTRDAVLDARTALSITPSASVLTLLAVTPSCTWRTLRLQL